MSTPEFFTPDLTELSRVSAQLGADPMLVQSAGGNTSVKIDEVMWIKASGTLLEEAEDKPIFVPVDLPRMRECITSADPKADQPKEFLLDAAFTLRPSIETSLHAIFSQRYVLHVHCVHTLAHAVRSDAEHLLEPLLQGLDWAMVPYTKPGAELATCVAAAMTSKTTVVILGNHGLLVAGDTLSEAHERVLDVHRRLHVEPAALQQPDLPKLQELIAGTDYELPDYSPAHQLALEKFRVAQAQAGSLYPDHVIFCGVAVTVLAAGESLNALAQRYLDADCPAPVVVLVPGAGVVVLKQASAGARALIRCLADVLLRVPEEAPLQYLSDEQNAQLLNWDAEKYRQSLNV